MSKVDMPITKYTQEALEDPEAFFEKYARYDPRNAEAYSITFNGYGLTSTDTMDLARRFRRAVARYKRKAGRNSQ